MWPMKRKNLGRLILKLSVVNSLLKKETKHTFNELGIKLRRKGMIEEAISNYLKAIEIDPKDEVLYHNLAGAYYKQGDPEKAIAQLKLALKLKPDFKEAQDLIVGIESLTSSLRNER